MHIDPRTPPVELLDRLGPGVRDAQVFSLEGALEYCRGLATSHYENFSVLTRLVPTELRDDFAAVYAFCRWADDLGDETGKDEAARERSLELLGWWRLCLMESVEDDAQPRHPVFVALRRTLERHRSAGLNEKPFDDLIRAFEQDQRVTRYATWEQLLGYCRLSANPVGRIVLMLGGWASPEIELRNAERFRLSDLTCTALQLINFWQDVRRDLVERDRVYVPVRETEISAEELKAWLEPPGSRDPANRVRYIRALRVLVERTGEMFEEAAGLPKMLDRTFGPIVWLLGSGGRAVTQQVLAEGCTTLWKRPRLSSVDKGLLIARAWWLRARWSYDCAK